MITLPTIAPPTIAAEFIDAEFGYDTTSVLHGINLRIESGEMVGLLGPSGAGKTTLLRALLGQVRARAGTVRVGGAVPKRSTSRVGYVPQLDTVDWPSGHRGRCRRHGVGGRGRGVAVAACGRPPAP